MPMQVGISSVWFEGNPCNMHLLELASYVKEGIENAGLVGYRSAYPHVHALIIARLTRANEARYNSASTLSSLILRIQPM